MNSDGKRFHLSPFGILVVGAALYVGANMWLDSYREHHAAEVVAQVLNSPEMANTQLDTVQASTRDLCEAKGYSAIKCDGILNTHSN